MSIGIICYFCVHDHGDGTCTAFPEDRPMGIGVWGHIRPVNGDHGIQFAPRDDLEDYEKDLLITGWSYDVDRPEMMKRIIAAETIEDLEAVVREFGVKSCGRDGAMPGKIITVVNFKGGVGKTTLSVNVAACIAKEHPDKQVALIDLDPQSNSSVWMLNPGRWEELNGTNDYRKKTTFAMFLGTVSRDAFVTPYDNQKLNEYLPNLSLLPATYKMVTLERKIIDLIAKKKIDGTYHEGIEYLFLHHDAKVLRDWFDYVLIDCPPNLYFGSQNAICNSDFLLIPCVPDSLSTSGLHILVDEIQKTIDLLSKRKRNYAAPTILGVAITRVKKDTNEHKIGMDRIRSRVQERQVEEGKLITPRTKVFLEHVIREYLVHAEAVQDSLPLCFKAPRTPAYEDIRLFTADFLAAMEEYE